MMIKDPTESVVLEFDFSSELTGIDSATVEAEAAEDPLAAQFLTGTAQIAAASVLQRISGGVDGVRYTVRCTAVSGADVIVRTGVVAVRRA